MHRIALLFAMTACVGSGTAVDDERTSTDEALVSTPFTERAGDVLNPERGFYDVIDLVNGRSFTGLRTKGITLGLAQIRLDSFRTRALDQAVLDRITTGLSRVRAAGIKVILRLQYNDGPVGAADATLDRIRGHVAQLQPILAANADVIAFVQAGLIGAWGEWHSSTNGLDTTANRRAVVDALLAAVPTDRMVQVRTPHFVSAMFPGGALTAAQAFTGTARARVGHHNDCFLASADDFGTYQSPVETGKTFIATDSQFTPMGGETCAVNAPRSDCASATQEMARLHFTYLNSLYHPDVLRSWTTQGCMPDVKARLGYRLVLDRVEHPARLVPGAELQLTLALRNTGYASPLNARPVEIVLDGPGGRRTLAAAGVDPRRWLPGSHEVPLAVTVPADLAPGSYRVAVRLPDAAATLAARPDYAIQFANTGVFDAATGDNIVATLPTD